MYFLVIGLFLTSFVYGNSPLYEAVRGKLVEPDKQGFKLFEDASLGTKKYIALYFGAHWCPPCNVFVPKLIRLYSEMQGGTPIADFEVIFVSADRSEGEMLRYMRVKKMPWPALRYEDIPTTYALTRYAGPGIPTFVVLDEQGNVLIDTFDRTNPKNPKYTNIDEVLYQFKKLLQKDAPAMPQVKG